MKVAPKVVVVLADGHPVQLVLPASRKVDLMLLSRILGTRDLRPAGELELRPGVETLVDESMRTSGDARFRAWLELTRPRVARFALP